MRFVFSVGVEVVELGRGDLPGGAAGTDGWRAVTRVLRSCGAGLGRAAGGAASDLVSVMWPSDCRLCGGPMARGGRSVVCGDCRGRVGALSGVLCVTCGDRLGAESARAHGGWGEGQCQMCRMAPPEFRRAVAFTAYEDDARELLHLLKFGGMRSVADEILGAGMAAAIAKLEKDAARELVVVPVPLFGARERARGFNQARVLASAAVRRLRRERPGWRLELTHGVLERVKDTAAMFGMNPRERRVNLRGAFRVSDPERVRGREVLLVDDILTTGATARECSRVLMKAGASAVWVATFARAMEEAGIEESVARWGGEDGESAS